MKSKILILFSVIVIAVMGMISNVSAATPHVDNISLKKQGEFVELTVYTDGPVTFSHFIEEASAGKPYRVVLDLKNCLHKLPQFNYRELPTSTISAIRTSQYKIKPDKMVRVVADITRPVTYKVKQAQGRITLAFATPEEKEFEFWCVAPISDADKIELALYTPEEEKVVATVKAEEKKETSPEPPIQIKENEGIKKKFAEDKKQPEKETSEEKPENQSPQKKNQDTPTVKEKLAQIFDSKQTEPAQTKTEKVTEPEKTKSDKPVDADKVKTEPVKKQEIADSQPVNQTIQEQKYERDGEQDSPVIPPKKPSDPEEEKQPRDFNSEKELRKNPDRPTKTKGTLAASLPKREVVIYRSFGRRDPFMPLVAKSLSGFQEGVPPDVETLRLVGVLRGDSKNMALLEDIEGYGYILEDGDKVKNGYVIQINQNKVLFQIHEFGWSRTVALSMDLED